MFHNTIKPAKGAKTARRRLGRGIGSGLGKTSGKGHKGQKARAGGYHKLGFEGGQMPKHRRLPKFGFTSMTSSEKAELRLDVLNKVANDEEIDLLSLKRANFIGQKVKQVKIILAGEIKQVVKLKGILVTKGAKAAIEAAGGKIEE